VARLGAEILRLFYEMKSVVLYTDVTWPSQLLATDTFYDCLHCNMCTVIGLLQEFTDSQGVTNTCRIKELSMAF